MSKQPRRFRREPIRRGFTLVEILVVLVILGIMGSMVLVALNGVTTSARAARTRTIIATCDSVVQQLYEDTKYRALSIEVPSLYMSLGSDEVGREVLASEAGRVRLVMVRDLQRQIIPERYSDLVDGVNVTAACNLVMIDSSDNVVGTRSNPASRNTMPVSWQEDGKLLAMRDRLPGTQTVEHQGAECLYLIMATTYLGGTPAIDNIPEPNIGDTDGDGAPEILDGWGQPLGLLRWPVGFDDVTGTLDHDQVDDFDLYRSDFAYTFTSVPAAPGSPTTHPVTPNSSGAYEVNAPWALRPLIISAGSDGEFGITLDPVDGSDIAQTSFAYGSQTWPINATHMGNSQHLGRPAPPASYAYPDPYLRQFVEDNDPSAATRADTLRRLPGELLEESRRWVTDDNITNYDVGTSL